jgi:hypothetical protein
VSILTLMRTLKILLLLFVIAPIFARAADVKINCAPPTTFIDGTPIPAGTPMAFKLYAGSLLDTQPKCFFVRVGLAPNTYNYTATAVATVDGADTESDRSDPVQVVVPGTPPPPPPVFATTSTVAYTVVSGNNRLAFLIVGSVPLGTPCDPQQVANGFNLVPWTSVTFDGPAKPHAVLAQCH